MRKIILLVIFFSATVRVNPQEWMNKIAVLGPKGTFSEKAASILVPEAEIVFVSSIDQLFLLLETLETQYAVVPLQNSISGYVEEVITGLIEYDFFPEKETTLPIDFHIASFGNIETIKTLHTQPYAYKQCEKHLRKLCPYVEIVATKSTAEAAAILQDNPSEEIGAIVSMRLANLYKLPIIEKDIIDKENNFTRFLLLSDNESKPTGNDKTILFLFNHIEIKTIKELFASNHVKIYAMSDNIIEFAGHIEEKSIKNLVSELKRNYPIKVIGSYPAEQEGRKR